MQIDTPNRTYSPVKPDRAPVTPPKAVKQVDQRKQPREQGDEPARPPGTGQQPTSAEGDAEPSFDDFA